MNNARDGWLLAGICFNANGRTSRHDRGAIEKNNETAAIKQRASLWSRVYKPQK